MTAAPQNVLIVGAGLAGARCAETLRAEGFSGRITLVGEEPVPPYERPALSKEFLSGARDTDDLTLRPPCDTAPVGIGGVPASELLPELEARDGGLATDAGGRTAIPGVYACGDVATAWRPWLGAGLRVEHWAHVDIEGDPDSFRARYLAPDGRLVAALVANRPREVGALRRELSEARDPLAA